MLGRYYHLSPGLHYWTTASSWKPADHITETRTKGHVFCFILFEKSPHDPDWVTNSPEWILSRMQYRLSKNVFTLTHIPQTKSWIPLFKSLASRQTKYFVPKLLTVSQQHSPSKPRRNVYSERQLLNDNQKLISDSRRNRGRFKWHQQSILACK